MWPGVAQLMLRSNTVEMEVRCCRRWESTKVEAVVGVENWCGGRG